VELISGTPTSGIQQRYPGKSNISSSQKKYVCDNCTGDPPEIFFCASLMKKIYTEDMENINYI
jgi:hypothetical protein